MAGEPGGGEWVGDVVRPLFWCSWSVTEVISIDLV